MSTKTAPVRYASWNPPPQGYAQCYQDADHSVIETLKSSGTYCPSCYPVTRDLSVFADPPEGIGDKAVVVFWVLQLKDLVIATDGGCHFCGFIASRLLNDPAFTFIYSNPSDTQRITSCCHRAARTEKHQDVSDSVANLQKFLQNEPDTNFTVAVEPVVDYLSEEKKVGKVRFSLFRSNLSREVVSKFLGYRTEIVIELYALKDSAAAKHLRYRPVNLNPSSDDCIIQAKSWIQTCIESHPNCPSLPDSQIPTRILKIVSDDTLQLYSGNVKALYATLSYCWGGPQTFATTLDTITKFATGFPISELPKTLQDAVQVTKRLGLEYIWIDSLCIIQDSPSDKSHEIPRMALYYKNSYVTICASRDSCQETFLNITDQCELHPGSGIAKDLLNIPYVLPDGGVENIYFREESPYYLSWEPISKRAWTLQERILSPRVLIFGARTIWQCNSAQHSDGGNEDWSKDTRASAHQRLQLGFTKSTRVQDKDSATNATSSLYGIWHRAIHEFASRKLSFVEDKLPAIAGLAIEFSNLSGDSYLAGLWRTQLPRELLWSTYPKLHLDKPSTYRAPSWSWTSVDNDITFDRMAPLDAKCLATIIECNVIPKSSLSPFGEIIGGILKIEAFVLDIEKGEIEEFMRSQYMMPAPRGKGYDWHRVLINMMSDGPDSREKKEEWHVPDGTLLLALFVSKILKTEPQAVRGEGRSELKSTDANDDELDEKFNDAKESDKEESDDKVLALLYGLLIAPIGDGTYERIGAFTKLRARGEWNAPSNRRRVTIV